MALQLLPGAKNIQIGYPPYAFLTVPTTLTTPTMDATGEAVIFIGRAETSDEGSHTLNTTGSSSIQFQTGTTTFANAGTTFTVGVAAVDLTAGPPGRAVNVADIITFDVSAALTGGGGGLTTVAWNTVVPTTGTKTIAHGDLIAIAFQMTARAGVDVVRLNHAASPVDLHRPTVTNFTSATYSGINALANAVITFADGALGWIHYSDVFSTRAILTWNSGGATKEYGQLFNLPFPCKIYGAYFCVDPDANFDVVLYSSPLSGSPVAEKTVSFDANTALVAAGRHAIEFFGSPYDYVENTDVVVALKPGGSNISAYRKILGNAAHRVADPWGTVGYGVSRASAAFSNLNSSLDHVYIGLVVGAFDDGAGGGGGGGGAVFGSKGGVIT